MHHWNPINVWQTQLFVIFMYSKGIEKLRKPVGDTNEICYNKLIWRPPEEINYLAVARRDKLSGCHQKSYLAVARRVIWRPPKELFGGRQLSYLAAARREELSGGRGLFFV